MADLLPLRTLLEREPALADAIQALGRLAVDQHRLDEAAFRAPQDARDHVSVPILGLDRTLHQAYAYGQGDPPGTYAKDFASLSKSEARQIIELAAAAADRPTTEQPAPKYLVDLDQAAATPQAAFVRIDIRTWLSPLETEHPLSKHIGGLLVVSAARSFVDIRKTSLNTFIMLYQHQLSRSNRSPKDVMDALDAVRNVWRRALEHAGA